LWQYQTKNRATHAKGRIPGKRLSPFELQPRQINDKGVHKVPIQHLSPIMSIESMEEGLSHLQNITGPKGNNDITRDDESA
jgi:hypothetical protein